MTDSVMTSGLQISDKLGDNVLNSDELNASTNESHVLSPITSNTSTHSSPQPALDVNSHNSDRQKSDVLSDNQCNDKSYVKCMSYAKWTTTGAHVRPAELDDQTVSSLTPQQFVHHWTQQQLYIDYIESQLKQLNRDKSDLISLRESEEKLKQQQLEANRRENVLVMRLTTKEQEMQEYLNQIQELKQSQVPSTGQLQSVLIDPAINLMFDKMKREVDSSRAKVDEMQNELNAWKFTPDSTTGKRLMAKCRLLYQENEELGKMIASGRIAKLEGELALQKSFSEELKKSQSEIDEFLLELDEDVEGMQNTIYYLQQQLKETKEKLLKYESNQTVPQNQLNVRQCVQQNNSLDSNDHNVINKTTIERTLNTSDNLNEVVVENNCTDVDMNDSNGNDQSIDDSVVNSTETTLTNTVETNYSEPIVEHNLVHNSSNHTNNNNNYLSVNNEFVNKRTSCLTASDASDDHSAIDDDYKPPSVKVAKLNDNTSVTGVTDDDSYGNETNNSIHLNVNSNTHQTNCIEINGQSNR
ncbi:unnamed protein product [Medioppia subpectinata]|uniref:Pre-mRNA-splicing regulator WTAP n=1 Tax=Medioppia subpectinata TaxID=1979941 RepID=A0A7R9PZS7_9ACAR|nr:unnamed protein product [Medioppia subpectinata]CAG2107337.1 unnamed protein product [Medioppia subpectinata]